MSANILRLLCMTTLLAAPLSTPPAARGEAKIAVAIPDEYVMRNFVVTKTSGQVVPGLIVITAFDRASGAFTFGDVSGGTTTVPAAEIRSIVFRQDRVEASPVAQDPLRQITASPLEQRTLAIPADQLAIVDGMLGVDALPPASVPNGERWEVTTIEYDAARRSFSVGVSRVKYEVKYVGGGGTSFGSPRKALP
jgi:hypothetical protein